MVNSDVHDAQFGSGVAAQHVDGGAAAEHVEHHLRGDGPWVGGDPLVGHAVIAGEAADAFPSNGEVGGAAGQAVPHDELLQFAEAARRLGKIVQSGLESRFE